MAIALNFCLGLLWLFELPEFLYVSALIVPAAVMAELTPLRRGLAAAAYIATATAAFVVGIGNYFDSIIAAALIYVLMVSLSFAAGFCAGKINRPWLASLAFLLVICVPPVNFIFWPHPISTAGLLLPGLGWFGLFIVVISIAAIAGRIRVILASTVVLPCLALLFAQTPRATEPSPFHGVSVSAASLFGSAFSQHQKLITRALLTRAPRVLLPEMVAPDFWNDHACDLWVNRLSAQTDVKEILVGAAIGNASRYQNAVVRIRPTGCQPISIQTIPIPIAMWRPFTDQSAVTRTKHDPKIPGVMICYSTTQVWVWLLDLRHQPKNIVHLANLWWAPDSVVRAQKRLVGAWSKLFDLTLSEAYVHG